VAGVCLLPPPHTVVTPTLPFLFGCAWHLHKRGHSPASKAPLRGIWRCATAVLRAAFGQTQRSCWSFIVLPVIRTNNHLALYNRYVFVLFCYLELITAKTFQGGSRYTLPGRRRGNHLLRFVQHQLPSPAFTPCAHTTLYSSVPFPRTPSSHRTHTAPQGSFVPYTTLPHHCRRARRTCLSLPPCGHA